MARSLSIVTELYEPSLGGQESRFARFAEALAARGREVTVHTTDHTGGTLPRESVIHGVRVLRYLSLSGYVRNGSRGLWPLARYWRATRRLLRSLVHRGESVWVNEMPVVHLTGLRDAPGLVVDWCEYPTYWQVNGLARRVARRLRHGTAVSLAVAGHLKAVDPSASIEVVRTPIPAPGGPSPARESRTIAYIGRIVGHKNLDALARAVRAWNGDGGPHARLLIAGEGPERSGLERRYGNADGVRFLGRVDEAEKERLLRSAWMVAIPGTREGLPNVAAEATVYGTPLIASGSPQNSCGDFIRSNGIGVVARGTRATDFLEALRSIDPNSWDRWTSRAAELRSLYDPDVNVRRLEQALDRWAS